MLAGVKDLLAAGFKTGASPRNWAGYGDAVDLGRHDENAKTLMTDPQTSGGLLVACAPDVADDVLQVFHRDGFGDAAIVGEIVDGPARVTVR